MDPRSWVGAVLTGEVRLPDEADNDAQASEKRSHAESLAVHKILEGGVIRAAVFCVFVVEEDGEQAADQEEKGPLKHSFCIWNMGRRTRPPSILRGRDCCGAKRRSSFRVCLDSNNPIVFSSLVDHRPVDSPKTANNPFQLLPDLPIQVSIPIIRNLS